MYIASDLTLQQISLCNEKLPTGKTLFEGEML